jgi:serine phosphatase RsbU (regulator of sigma subunit)
MRPLPLNESIRLPEEQAVQRHFDDSNWKVVRWLLAGFSFGALGGTIAGLDEGILIPAIAWGALLLASIGLLITRRRSFVERYFRRLLIGYLLLIFAVLLSVSPDPDFGYALGGFIAPFVLLWMRLRRFELLSLLAISLGVALWFVLGPAQQPPLPLGAKFGMPIGAAVSALIVAGLSSRMTRKLEQSFLTEWRREHARAREQTRMRDELNDAREIQLSMLPRSTPQLPWLDIASVSLPATEVGGDYFDYVPIDPERLAMVVGDVAGHGMASGLVLAAIRGGVHLLREELTTPLRALQRLDRMVQEVSPGRLFVTLQIGIVDHGQRRITLVSAGHPPALHYRAASQDVVELGDGAVPLGTRLESRLVEHSADLEPGDVLVFYTDGLPEATDLRGDMFGDHRLRASLERSATGHSAAEIRTMLLESVNRFKGDVELADDITLVVAKLSG